MILAVRTTKKHQGFTLIEIVMVIAIAAIVMGGAVGLMVFSSDERTLRNASGEIELLAKRARTISILKQTPYALEFRHGMVRLLPLAQTGVENKKISRSNPKRNLQAPESASADESRQLALEDGLKISIRRWNSDEWLNTAKDAVHIWRFDPDGLCEPLSVRLALGTSFIEDTYHPLTATIRESQLEAR